MKTVIYLYDRTVRAVTGEAKNGTITIEKVCMEEAPPLSIVNGQVTDEETFGLFLKSFWEKNQLPKKEVCLVVNSTQTMIRFFDAPKMSHKKMMGYLPKGFIGIERMQEPLYSYGRLKRGGALDESRIYGVVMEKEFLREHVRRFQDLGIHLVSVGTALAVQLKLLEELERLKDELCVIQLLDGTALLSILWDHGGMVHFSRTRIKGRGRGLQIGAGCVEALDPLLQFAQSQQIEGKIRKVYLGGVTELGFEKCARSVRQLDQELRLCPFRDAAGDPLVFSEEAEGCEPGGIAAAIGGLLLSPGRSDLLYQYKRDPEMMAHRKAIFRFYLPFLGTAALLTVVVAVQAAIWSYLSGQVDRCLERISDPQVLAGAANYDKLTAENETIKERLEATEKILDAMGTYPVMSTEIDQVVGGCADGLVTAKVVSFQAADGKVLVSCSAEDELSIHQFIDRLALEEEVFSSIRYTGFEYVEGEQIWRLSVECYLRGRGEKEDGRCD